MGERRVPLGHGAASQWVLFGGSIEKLKEILGHYSVIVTERTQH